MVIQQRPFGEREAAMQPEYGISARVHDSSTTGSSRIECAVLLNLHKINSSGDWGRNRRQSFILLHAADALIGLCTSILEADFILRIDLPPDIDVRDEYPIFAHNHHEFVTGMRSILERIQDDLIYPFSIWGIPHAQVTITNRTINAFQSLRMDGSLFDEIIALGGLRIAAFQSSLTLSLNCVDLARGITWVKAALTKVDVPVEWARGL